MSELVHVWEFPLQNFSGLGSACYDREIIRALAYFFEVPKLTNLNAVLMLRTIEGIKSAIIIHNFSYGILFRWLIATVPCRETIGHAISLYLKEQTLIKP